MGFKCPRCNEDFDKNKQDLINHFHKNRECNAFQEMMFLYRTGKWHKLTPIIKKLYKDKLSNEDFKRAMSNVSE